MKHDNHIEAAAQVPRWLAPEEARDQLHKKIDRFVKAAAKGKAKPDAALALKVTAGLGKTATTLRVIAHYGKALLAKGHVLFYVPTLDLAERACADFRLLAPDMPSRVIRGRSARRPDDPELKMCERAEIAMKIAGFVESVTEALCRGLGPDNNFVQSACASKCPYLHQKDVSGPHVVFLSHAYLTVDAPVDQEYPVALRVIDEKVWPTLARSSHLAIDDLMRAAPSSLPKDLHKVLSLVKAAVVDGLQRDLPLHEHIRTVGIDTEKLLRLAKEEKQSRGPLEIGPWQSPALFDFCVNTFDTKSFIASRQRQQILRRLAEREAGHCVGLKLIEMRTELGSQQVIQSADIDEITRDGPLLLLDADADPEITECIAPGAAFVSIQSPPIAEIIQVSDLTLSDTWLRDPVEGAQRRAAVLTIVKREVDKAAGGGVLLVATKSVLSALHTDLGNASDSDDDEALRQPILGAEPRWFGPRMQGVNDYEAYATIIVVGRLQPGASDLETMARAVFSQDETPIAAHISGPLPGSTAPILMSDGSLIEAPQRAHPDPRAQTILAQSRECATLQAIARLRLVSPNCKKRVLLLSNMPLPEFPVSRLTTLAALQRGLEYETDWQGFLRMETALHASMGRPVRGTRLSASGLETDLPRDFVSVDSAKRFRRGRSTSHLLSLCRRVAAANGWQCIPLNLTRSSGGKPVPALIFEHDGAPLETARALWPQFTPELA